MVDSFCGYLWLDCCVCLMLAYCLRFADGCLWFFCDVFVMLVGCLVWFWTSLFIIDLRMCSGILCT